MLGEKHKGADVYQKAPSCSSGLDALIQESPTSLPNKPNHKLGPAPKSRAKAWSLWGEAHVVGTHQNRHPKCAWLLPDC